ncbi:MAG: hypothetical protein II059_09580, partial [Clostridia bacterium]|nr:hypothetical protein [Clostridia bacterium]
KRGRLTIDCESPRWQKVFRLWNALLPLRPLLLLSPAVSVGAVAYGNVCHRQTAPCVIFAQFA